MAFFGNAGGNLMSGKGLFGAVLGAFTGGGGGEKVFNDVQTPMVMAANGGRIPGGKPSLVGEKGPELFTPASSGFVTPNHALGGSTNVVVNVDASGSNVQGDEERSNEFGEQIAAAVQAVIIDEKRVGGLLG